MSNYTKEELTNMSRVELRRAAIEVLKVDNKAVSNEKSTDLIAKILEAQEGGGGKKGKAAPAGRAGKTPGAGKAAPKEPEETPEETPEEEPEPPKGKAAAAPPTAGLKELRGCIDAVGKTVDENQAEVKELLAEIDRKLFIVFGLMTDVFKAVNEPDDLDGRLNELQEEWESGDAEGNEE